MQYNQPYGVSDPNAAYVNGNPSTGTMGSIPPAASIEYPQREIVAVIAAANLAAPSNSDTSQMAKAIQSMLLISDDDVGTVNQLQVTMSPAPTGYFKYMTVVCKIANTNSGASTLNVNALGSKPIVHIDGSQLTSNELHVGAIVCFIYDGNNFQLVWSSSVGGGSGSGGPIYLLAPKTLYVNWNTGDDTNFDGSTAASVAGTNHGPFKTIQRACNEINKFNLNNFNVTVNIADSLSYPNFVMAKPGGSGSVAYNGNPATPTNVKVTGVDHTAIIGSNCSASLNGFFVTSSGNWQTFQDDISGIAIAGGGSSVSIQNIWYGPVQGGMLDISRAADVYLTGAHNIAGGAPGNATSPGAFLKCFFSATVETNGSTLPTMVVENNYSLQYFIWASNLGVTFVLFAGISNPGSFSGTKYLATTNAVINSGGSGINYYPGSSAGSTGSGGQYV
jgi:hypothetical protein